MANTAPPMTVLEVKKIFEPGLHFVGGTRGLILNVGQRGSRSLILRFTASNGKRRDMGLGSYPDVGRHTSARDCEPFARSRGLL